MRDKNYLNITVNLLTLSNLYESGISEEDLLIVKSFLTLLRKENYLNLNEHANSPDHRLTLNKIVETVSHSEIRELYNDYIEQICGSIRKKFFNDLIGIYADISDDFINNNVREFFDEELKIAFNRNKIGGSDSMQPLELTALLNSFCDKQNTTDYYNPFAGLASLALNLPKHINYLGEEYNLKTWLLGKLRILVYNCPINLDYQLANSIEKWSFPNGKLYDYISFNPPFNIKLDKSYLPFLNEDPYGYTGNANSLIISHCFKMLKPGGKMAFVMTSGFLSSNSTKDKQLKKDLIENGNIEKIIALPNQILNHTGISVNIIILNKSIASNHEIEFIDASEKFKKEDGKLNTIQLIETLQLINDEPNKLKRRVHIKEIAANDYNLAVNRYVFEDLGLNIEEEKALIKLKDLIKPISRKRTGTTQGKFVRIRDLSDNTVDYTKSFKELEEVELRPSANLLDNDTLLIATTWKSLKPTLFLSKDTNVFYDFNTILACKVNESKIDKEYLILELQKEYVQNQIEQRRTGTAVTRILRHDFLEIEIVVPDLELQNKRKYSHKEAIIRKQQDKVKELMLQYGIDVADENSFLRHKIAGTLKNLRGSYSKLKQIIDEQIALKLPEIYDYKLNHRIDSNFLDYLSRIDRDLNSIHEAVQAVGVELNLKEIQPVPINFIRFIKDYVEEVKNRKSIDFNISLRYDREALKEHKIKDVIVNGDKELLRQVFDNIIENAERHAFSHNRKNILNVLAYFDFTEMNIKIEFANNGIPLPEDFKVQTFIRKGSKSSLKGGKGMGGWLIHEVMKKHNGNLSITKYHSGSRVKTGIVLNFPINLKT